MSIKIKFLPWTEKEPLEYDVKTLKEAFEKAVEGGANLSRASLYGANLDGANLYGASLYGANLYGANLSRANLYGANLSRANLYGANLSRATLSRATLDGKELWHVRPLLHLGLCGSEDRMTNVFFFEDGCEPIVNCGCFCGNIEEFAAEIHKTHAGTFHEVEYMAMVEHIKAIRKYQIETEHPENNEGKDE